MKASWFLLPLLIAVPLRAGGPSAEQILQQGVADYRAGRFFESMTDMAEVLEKDPENVTAKNYLWTLARHMRDKNPQYRFSPGEERSVVEAALKSLEDRRRRTEEALATLKRVYENSRDVRSPEQVLADMQGLDRFLEGDLASERVNDQAESYFKKILENLSADIDKQVFVSEKDLLAAQAHLAYYRGEWEKSLSFWSEACRGAAPDSSACQNRDRLKKLMDTRAQREKIRDAAEQAAMLQKTGYPEEAAEEWKEVLALDPSHAGALQNLPLCRKEVAEKKRLEDLRRKTNDGVKLYKQGDYVEAAQAWLQVLQEEPGYEQARVWLSQVGKKLQMPERGRESLHPAAAASTADDADKAKAFDLYKKGILFYAEDKVPQAIEVWKESLRLDPSLLKAKQALDQAKWEMDFNK